MLQRVRLVGLLLVAATALAACCDFRPGTRLALAVDTVDLLTDDCPIAPIAPIKPMRVDTTVEFVDAVTGAPVAIVWPVGFAAWEVEGVTTVHATDGTVVGREGETLSDIRAVAGVRGDDLRVCAIGVRSYR
jgi:hypothetical protein